MDFSSPSLVVLAKGGADGGALSIVIFQIVASFIGGMIIPIIFFLANRSKANSDKLQNKVETSQERLQQEKQEKLENQITDIGKSLKDLADKTALTEMRQQLTKLQESFSSFQREFDQRLSTCQRSFVGVDTYKREISSQRQYLRFIVGFIKKQADNLDRGEEDGEE